MLGAVGVGAGTIGTSPAKVEAEKAHVKATAMMKRFIIFLSLEFEDAKTRTKNRIDQLPEVLARLWLCD